MKTLVVVALVCALGCTKKQPAPAATGSGSAVAAAPVEGSAAPAPQADADCKDEHDFKLAACVAQCDGGKGHGCYVAGQAWLVGDQVPDADEAKAHDYFTKGCALDDAFACKWLAPTVDDPAKKAETEDKARKLYAPLCDKGDAQACYDLYSIAKDPQQKKDAAKKACDLGKKPACDAAK